MSFCSNNLKMNTGGTTVKTRFNRINQGTYFKLKPTDTAPVMVRII